MRVEPSMTIGAKLGLWIACFLWAISFIATKVALEEVPPLTVVALRLLVSGVCFLVWFLAKGGFGSLGLRGKLRELFLLSLLGTGLHYGSQTIGLQFTTASNASVYAVTGPISITLIAAIFLGEKITTRKVVGIAVALAGVLWVMGEETLTDFRFGAHVLGDALVFASIVLWAGFTVYGKKLMEERGPLEVIGLTTVLGALWMAPVGGIELILSGSSLSNMQWRALLAIGFLGVTCSFLATLLYFTALKRTESQKVGVYLYTIPPMTYLFADFYLGETIGVNLVLGSVLILAGVYVTERG